MLETERLNHFFYSDQEFLPGVNPDRVFNFFHELNRAREVMKQSFSAEVVYSWLHHQVRFFLSEFGLGESLAIQPPYWLFLKKEGDFLNILVPGSVAYGDQVKSYTEAEGFPAAIKEGLLTAYQLLSEAEVGMGAMIVSPTEFYQDYGSKYDVLNFFRVKEVNEDGSRLIEGRYVLTNILPDYARAWLLNWHNPEACIESEASPEKIVASPQLFRYPGIFLQNEDPIAGHMGILTDRFEKQFHQGLLAGSDERNLYELVKELTDSVIDSLHGFLLKGDKFGFMRKLKEVTLNSQARWANFKGLDPLIHLRDIFCGLVAIGGIHGSSTSSVDLNLNISFNKEKPTKHCPIHGDYQGEVCYKCSL